MGESSLDAPQEAAPGAGRRPAAAGPELPAEGEVFDVDVYIEAWDSEAPERASGGVSRDPTGERSGAQSLNLGASAMMGSISTGQGQQYETYSTLGSEAGALGSYMRAASTTSEAPRLPSVQSTLSLDLQGNCQLRGIEAGHVLRFPGRMFWTSEPKGSAFGLSKEVDALSWFISHSWQASATAKYLALCLHFRWKPGFGIGLVASLVGVMLFPLELAPQLQIYVFVALASGLCGMWFAMLCWPCRDNVFLDKACIEQESIIRKRDGIMSLGHFVSKSMNVLVLWDESFVTRLWCVFEYAVGLKLSEAHGQAVIDKANGAEGDKPGQAAIAKTNSAEGDKPGSAACKVPSQSEIGGVTIAAQPMAHCSMIAAVLLGSAFYISLHRGSELLTGQAQATSTEASPMTCLIHTLMITVCIMVVSMASDASIQRHVQSSENQLLRLSTFKAQEAQCSCCTLGHTDPVTLEHIPCDRALIESMVQQWFGSAGAFDRYVQETIKGHMSTQVFLPYCFVVFGCSPLLFDGIAGAMWHLKSGIQQLEGIAYFAYKFWAAVVTVPLMWFIVFALAQRMRKSGRLLRGVAAGLACIPVVAGHRFAFGYLEAWAYIGLVPVFGGITLACYSGCCW